MTDAFSFSHPADRVGSEWDAESPLDRAAPQSGQASWIGGAGATAVHAVLVVLAWGLAASGQSPSSVPALVTQMVEVPVEIEPPPPPLPPPEAAPEPQPEPKARMAPAPAEPPPPAAPAAAQAAQVLTQEPTTEPIVDFDAAFVQGAGLSYAGGVTASAGTSRRAVRGTGARAGGVLGGTGTDESGVDRSRAPALAGGAKWDCPFPREAEFEDISGATVTLSVRVSAVGSVEDVGIKQDPGSGFGREARRCALSKRWAPGLDRAGNAVAMTSLVNVRFVRAD